MQKVTSFWFKVTSIDNTDSVTDDIDSEINGWAKDNHATILNTSMCVEPSRGILYVLVVYSTD